MVNFEIDYKAIGKRIRFFRKQQKKILTAQLSCTILFFIPFTF